MGKHRRPRNYFAWGVLTATAVGAFSIGFFPTMANAATEEPIPVESTCLNDAWYVNPDEGDLLPTQTPLGLLFDGPSLIHHAAMGFLKDAPGNGSFVATVETGVAPLFKMETLAPYSTINKTGAGKFWSSKISSGPGSQGEPVDALADLVGKWNYTETTTMLSFGVGYANDTGNKATVSSITYGEETYDLTCSPLEESPSPSPSATTPAPTNTATPGATVSPSRTPVAVQLPVTGSNKTPYLMGAGVVVLVAGGLLAFATRTRRVRVEVPRNDL